MQTITLQMTTPENLSVERIIDISNFQSFNGGIIKEKSIQKEILEEWIDLRGNQQHETKLTLISWTINK